VAPSCAPECGLVASGNTSDAGKEFYLHTHAQAASCHAHRPIQPAFMLRGRARGIQARSARGA
jgi:hypothetical protein